MFWERKPNRKSKIEYELVRSNRRTIGISVGRDGKVTVRAPYRVSLSYIESFVASKQEWILDKQKLQLSRSESLDQSFEETPEGAMIVAALRKRAGEIIKSRVAYYAPKVGGGVSYNRIAIKDTKTRWGSCSSKGNLNFSWRLVLAPEYVMDYVVIHELCHRVHMDHSKDFWKLVASVQPSYKISRDWLKMHGNELIVTATQND